MEFNKIKIGDYFRWVAERYMRSWDVYGKVINIGEEGILKNGQPAQYIEVLTFDDNKVTKLYHRPNDEEGAIKYEMVKVDKFEVKDWLEERLDSYKDKKRKIKNVYRKKKREINKEISILKNIEI